MTKDEMKNRISMALKDPILQQGFECICKELEAEKKLNEEIKVRFVKCNTCTDDMKDKCIMFSENLCEGERCEELVDLLELINKSDLQKENAELKEALAEQKQYIAFKCEDNKKIIDNLRQENTELKETLKTYNGCGDWDNDFHTCRVYLQHEELEMYIHQLREVKEILQLFLKLKITPCASGNSINMFQFENVCKQAEQFLKDSEVEK